MNFNIIQDYFSDTMPPSVTYAEKGVYLYKDITPIYSLNNPDEIVSYHCLKQCIRQEFESRKIVEDNFDLIWKAYGECGYDGNILTDSIETVMDFWHSKNTENLENYLATHPILYTDGFYYGVEEKDQNEMTREYASYKMEEGAGLNPVGVEWHSKKGECKYMSEEEFIALAATVKAYAMTYYHLMQSRKKQIYQCTNKSDIFDIPITYEEINIKE